MSNEQNEYISLHIDILKKALKEIHNLGGDYVSVLVNQNNE